MSFFCQFYKGINSSPILDLWDSKDISPSQSSREEANFIKKNVFLFAIQSAKSRTNIKDKNERVSFDLRNECSLQLFDRLSFRQDEWITTIQSRLQKCNQLFLMTGEREIEIVTRIRIESPRFFGEIIPFFFNFSREIEVE